MGLSKNKIKYIQSLSNKKGRSAHNTFLAEGNKLVSELLASLNCQLLITTSDFLAENPNSKAQEIIEVSQDEINKAGLVKTPQQALAVFFQPKYAIDSAIINNELSLILDGIQDPGNMGTIMRLADWYGIKNIYCSQDTVDLYNPKTVQATMGAIARVRVHYTDLEELIKSNSDIPTFGTFLDGENIYSTELSRNGLIVMGNEGNGIRPALKSLITNKLYLPPYPIDSQSSESLNVAIATAIVCAEFRRRSF